MTNVYWRVVRRSALITAAAAVVMIGICVGVDGAKGLYGALIGAGIVAVFFGISVVAVGQAAKVSPQMMMMAAMGSYIVKIIVLMIVVASLENSTAFNPKLLALTALVSILTWCAAQVVMTIKSKMLYVDPDGGAR
jgi:ATP synthase protein I